MSYLDELAQRIEAKVAPELVPDGSADLFRIYAVLLRAKGAEVDAEDVHDAWVAWKESKDEQHPALVPYSQLEPQTQREDVPFVEAIRAVAREL